MSKKSIQSEIRKAFEKTSKEAVSTLDYYSFVEGYITGRLKEIAQSEQLIKEVFGNMKK